MDHMVPPADRQVFDAVLEVRPQPYRRAGRCDLAEAVEHGGEQGPHLYPGQVRGDAEVRPVPEGQVRVGIPVDVEPVGVGEHRLVPVRRGEVDDDLVTGVDGYAADDGV